MFEIILFVVLFAIDQLVKYWSVNALAYIPEGISLFGNYLRLDYAENWANNVSFIRGRSSFMNVVRILQLVVVIYLLVKHKHKMAKVTRIGLVLFLAGLIGNQFNYFTMGYVPDMFILWLMPNIVFNVADIYVFIAMIILFIRLAFFEGQDLINWIIDKTGKKT